MDLIRIIRTIFQIVILYVFYLVGTWIVTVTGLPLPGSIIGLLLLSIGLFTKIINVKLIEAGASFLIGVLTIFFIPATVGIVKYPELLSSNGAKLILAVLCSSVLTIYITGVFTKYVEKKSLVKKEEEL
ncbi:holin-like protein CidA 2 [Lysinibacillus alkalisoli]|uniref:Holin-like protein CidA 2 n=1 Tax=Lysinibacillus alkalisoli TaxID=1911548 RepID=A0A917G3A7_9BACI|nr:CidA/LrgA family holin-like protein [Lysinibacillus alkalisoli]GGG20658.1 holin-like protein CidA 2 [Lysinibacillus alkalisoli]